MIKAWLAGSMSTAELHTEMMDPEYLRWLRSDYVLALIDHYRPIEPEAEPKRGPAQPVQAYSLGTVNGCAEHWAHGGY